MGCTPHTTLRGWVMPMVPCSANPALYSICDEVCVCVRLLDVYATAKGCPHYLGNLGCLARACLCNNYYYRIGPDCCHNFLLMGVNGQLGGR